MPDIVGGKAQGARVEQGFDDRGPCLCRLELRRCVPYSCKVRSESSCVPPAIALSASYLVDEHNPSEEVKFHNTLVM